MSPSFGSRPCLTVSFGRRTDAASGRTPYMRQRDSRCRLVPCGTRPGAPVRRGRRRARRALGRDRARASSTTATAASRTASACACSAIARSRRTPCRKGFLAVWRSAPRFLPERAKAFDVDPRARPSPRGGHRPARAAQEDRLARARARAARRSRGRQRLAPPRARARAEGARAAPRSAARGARARLLRRVHAVGACGEARPARRYHQEQDVHRAREMRELLGDAEEMAWSH